MNLDDQYNPAHRQAQHLQETFHTYVRLNPAQHDPDATILQHEMHELVGELERHEHPQNIEHRIKTIQRELRNEQMRKEPVAQYGHLNELQSHYEVLRQQIRKFNNF